MRLAVLPSSHDAVGLAEVTLEELDPLGFLWCRVGDEVAHAYWRMDAARGGPPPISALCDNPQELFLDVVAGKGVCSIPSGFREQFGFGGLALVPVAGTAPVPVDIAHRAGTTSPLLDELVASIRRLSPAYAPVGADLG